MQTCRRRSLDRTQWPLTLSVSAYGVRFGVQVNDPSIADGLPNHLPPELEECGALRHRAHVFAIGRSGIDRTGRQRYCGVRRRRVARPLLDASGRPARLRGKRPALRRGDGTGSRVCARGRRRLPRGGRFCYRDAASAGKSTLVAELVRAGAEYYSDEYAVLDSAGGVHPYPRPLSVRQAGGPGVTKQPVHVAGAHATNDPLPVGLVVVSKFDRAASGGRSACRRAAARSRCSPTRWRRAASRTSFWHGCTESSPARRSSPASAEKHRTSSNPSSSGRRRVDDRVGE